MELSKINKKIPVLVIVGPTASGKTNLSIALAKRYNAEIVSADSMQIYKGMTIGTAKPTIEEMQGIKHHLIDVIEPNISFNVSDYCNLAHTIINDIVKRNKNVIVCGGTGLYVKSLIDNITFAKEESDNSVKIELMDFYEKNGADALFEKLEKKDPLASKTIHKNNIPRVIRAIEMMIKSGETVTNNLEKSRENPSNYNPLYIGLDYQNRDILYSRINKRVDIMIEDGLLDEVDKISKIKDLATSYQAIGYKELMPYVLNKLDLKTCVDKLKQNTRHYAKRQLTWNRKESRINLFLVDTYQDENALFNSIIKLIDKNNLF